MEGWCKSSWTGVHEFFSQRSMMQEHRQQSACGGQLGALTRILKYFEFQSWRINVISEKDFDL
jgi:hypothetical protein